jgi:integrase
VALEDVHSYETEVWLLALPIGSRRKGHIHGLMRVLFRYAMHIRWLELGANPMKTFKIAGGTKRDKVPGTLTKDQIHKLIQEFGEEPYRTMIIASIVLGLRVSELFALRWSDLDFLGGEIGIERAIVEGRVGDVKTQGSAGRLPLHRYVAGIFQSWYSQTKFKDPGDYVFASPWKAGELPYNSSKIQADILRKAGKDIGLTFNLGWHTFRHTYRALLRQTGAPLDIQRDLMRHADIYMTSDYGGTALDELRPINESVVESLFGRKQ